MKCLCDWRPGGDQAVSAVRLRMPSSSSSSLGLVAYYSDCSKCSCPAEQRQFGLCTPTATTQTAFTLSTHSYIPLLFLPWSTGAPVSSMTEGGGLLLLLLLLLLPSFLSDQYSILYTLAGVMRMHSAGKQAADCSCSFAHSHSPLSLTCFFGAFPFSLGASCRRRLIKRIKRTDHKPLSSLEKEEANLHPRKR